MSATNRRIIIKLSGEVLGEPGKIFSHQKIEDAAAMLIRVQQLGIQTAVVIGGGNVWRGRRGDAVKMGTVAADQMGMLGTLQNCLYMRDTLDRLGAKATVMSGTDIPRFAEPYNTVAAIRFLEAGHILLLACGLGNPCFSTDSAVALRAVELECDTVLMAKAVDGVYTGDPNIDPTAKLIPEATYAEVIEKGLKVVDQAALHILLENNVPMVRIFGLEPPENILAVLQGDPMGSSVHP